MQISSFENLLGNFGNSIKPQMNMSIYRDNFNCACGSSHWFDERIVIICEGSMKVLVLCPETKRHITSVKIKTFMLLKFKGFESLEGAKLENAEDMESLELLRLAYR